MSKYSSYTGSIEVISGLKQKNGGDFPLIDAHDVQVKEDGTRLSTFLENLSFGSGSSLTITDDGEGNVVISDGSSA